MPNLKINQAPMLAAFGAPEMHLERLQKASRKPRSQVPRVLPGLVIQQLQLKQLQVVVVAVAQQRLLGHQFRKQFRVPQHPRKRSMPPKSPHLHLRNLCPHLDKCSLRHRHLIPWGLKICLLCWEEASLGNRSQSNLQLQALLQQRRSSGLFHLPPRHLHHLHRGVPCHKAISLQRRPCSRLNQRSRPNQ